jgi:g-D-glutamyl-meso-diaminopimelate peptidase
MFILLIGCVSSEAAGAASDTVRVSNGSSSGKAVDDSSTLDNGKTKVDVSKQKLIIYTTPDKYTNEDFLNDISVLKSNYDKYINLSVIGHTVDGRGIYDVTVGSPNTDNQILILGEMHAREYITSQTVMRLLCKTIDGIRGYDGEYHGIPVKKLLDNVCIHFVPISNPDGMAISQFGIDGIHNSGIRQDIANMNNLEGYTEWKANANGVDLNRNFDAGWTDFVGSDKPSSERYKGAYPGCEAESAALIELTKKYHIKRSISYHTCGALIYWYYKQEETVLEDSRKFAQRISDETGYPLDSDYTAVDAAGFKDWAVYKMGIPSITIETGAENGYLVTNPVPIDRFGYIWTCNKDVVYATVYNLKYDHKH